MAISLAKGQKINLSKNFGAGGDGLKKLQFGLGWDTNKYDGGKDFDLDGSVFMLNDAGKSDPSGSGFIFYGNKESADGSVKHSGDNRTGEGDGDDEQVVVDLTKVDSGIKKIALTVTINDAVKRAQNFGQVSNAYVRIVNPETNEELVKYELDEDYSVETAVVVAELYNKDGEWRFAAVGSGFSGGLAALATSYGLDVTED